MVAHSTYIVTLGTAAIKLLMPSINALHSYLITYYDTSILNDRLLPPWRSPYWLVA
jgi:hypothetical protein